MLSGFEHSASSTESLSSSILEHVYENGRRYHRKSSDKYLMPSDEKEQDRLDLGHREFTNPRSAFCFLPLSNPNRRHCIKRERRERVRLMLMGI